MKNIKILVILAVLLVAAAPALAEIQLKALTLTEGKNVQITFNKTPRAPSRSSLSAELSFSKGVTTVDLSFEKLEPAILFAGNITTYVVWSVNPAGACENLGEIFVDRREASGSQKFYAPGKILALMITAEPYSVVSKPSEIVLYYNGETREKNVQIVPFAFKDFSSEATPALDSIAMLQYSTDLPVTLFQAEKTIEYANKINAAEHNPKAMEEAKKALERARTLTRDKKNMAETARIAVQHATRAIKDTVKYLEEKAAAEEEARRQAEKAALEKRAAQAESEAEKLAVQLEEIKQERAALDKEMADLARQMRELAEERDRLALETERLAAEREAIKKERDELASKLKGALSSVAETTETARGLMVNLAGVLFDVNKATLKPESQLKLAKLAGILMVFQDMKLSIEGHTDSTGSEELNLRLSTDRARTVYEFLMGQGVSPDRMKYQGFGSSKPVAPNDTEANRAKNRRVEVIVLREE
ncbi:MAG: Outer membrane lipoprotein omp16 precursor [Candidatus Saccharicenans subterraneus]|uniref:Outer membrane lipoprotein omp16 n=1 Tax=Candidatus Saccharicenans subterraneus TaxID=2508984 RepID=A0A3E2BQX3_9BACT|nr:MAG: Outer membrane lipoprotein omp16 precursor [Candidatus Saccharicenans subterraneum]